MKLAHRGFRDAISALTDSMNAGTGDQRIAHAVHDEAGQLLVAARLAMSGVAHDLSPHSKDVWRKWERFSIKWKSSCADFPMSSGPTILDDLGLAPALQFPCRWHLEKRNASSGSRTPWRAAMPLTLKTALYRIIQEALTNVTKHARARTWRFSSLTWQGIYIA